MWVLVLDECFVVDWGKGKDLEYCDVCGYGVCVGTVFGTVYEGQLITHKIVGMFHIKIT